MVTLNQNILHQMIEAYAHDLPLFWEDEKYKWEAVKQFQEEWDVNAPDFKEMFMKATSKHENLIQSGKYFPKRMMEVFADADSERVRKMFINLYDEKQNLSDRIEAFKKESDGILKQYTQAKNHFQDTRAISVYLFFRYPQKYYIYKDVEYKHAVELFQAQSVTGRTTRYGYYEQTLDFFDTIRAELLNNIGIRNFFSRHMSSDMYNDVQMNIATVDFIFYLYHKYDKLQTEKHNTTMDYSAIIKLLETNKNLILNGAPGTGKTHLAMQLARELGADAKTICKVQFHPSYDYTDFVEGIRPMEDGTFKRVDGEFKAFCKRALLAQNTGTDILSELNEDPKVWKVSLAGTGDNPIRTDCLENGYIRIGWSGYGDVEDFNDFDNFTSGGRWILRNYQSVMRKGDIIVSCYSANETDAIGIITDDYEFRPEGGEYPRYRPVRWLVKDIRENIVGINQDKKFTLSTIYISNIKVTDALAVVNKYKPTIVPTNKPFVFIIDEINRGELSKIFGELFGAIEADYRGKEKGHVHTQYQNMVPEGDPFKDDFFVPENVYIIGTMNDIDRSVESMDFAMRRRFAWKEVTALDSYTAIIEKNNEFVGDKAEIKQRMSRLNVEIEKQLGRAYQIGAAYFLNLRNNDFEALWKNHLEGLIFEYFRGERDAQQKVEELHAIYKNEPSDTNIG